MIQQRIEEKALKDLMQTLEPPPVLKMGAATYPEEAASDKELLRIARERLRG